MKTGLDLIGRTVTIEAAQRSCLDKKRYRTKTEARDKAAHIRHSMGTEQKPYRCAICSGFHLTTIKPEAGGANSRRNERKRA